MKISLLAGMLTLFCIPTTYGQVVRIEEDWVLTVSQPDEQLDAPQVQTALLPFGAGSDVMLQVDVNHASYPDFSAGGLQIKVWDGDTCLADSRFYEGVKLSYNQETVTWTQVVQLSNSGYYFGVKDGQSSSFGSFGGDSTFVHVPSSEFGSVSLNNYVPEKSVENSGVPYASNRVQGLKLTKLRVFYASGQTTEWVLNYDVQ